MFHLEHLLRLFSRKISICHLWEEVEELLAIVYNKAYFVLREVLIDGRLVLPSPLYKLRRDTNLIA